MKNCLFDLPDNNKNSDNIPPKCKNKETRDETFNLLRELCYDEDCCNVTINYLRPMHINEILRTPKKVDWDVSPIANEKSNTGYVGLKNLGCTC